MAEVEEMKRGGEGGRNGLDERKIGEEGDGINGEKGRKVWHCREGVGGRCGDGGRKRVRKGR